MLAKMTGPGKRYAVASCVVAMAAVCACLADEPSFGPGTDTVKYFLSKSDVVVTGDAIPGYWDWEMDAFGSYTYTVLVEVDEILVGSISWTNQVQHPRYATNRIDVFHRRQEHPVDEPRWSLFSLHEQSPERVRVIAFLEKWKGVAGPVYRTVDPWFGVLPYSGTQVWQIRQVTEQMKEGPRESRQSSR